jgi:hypothetical protein
MSKLKFVTKPLLFGIGLILVSSLMASGSSYKSQDDEGGCSDRSLKGDYGFSVEGWVLPGALLPIRGIHMTRFDGKGTFTQLDHIIVNGNPPAVEWTPVSGTYHVNANCTGTMTIVGGGSVTNLETVIVRGGKEIHTVVTAPFSGPPRTVTSVGIKVD